MPSNNTPKVIFLKGSPMGKEAVAAEAGILPGMLVDAVPGGDAAAHATAGGAAVPAFARANELVGNGIDVEYADGDTLLYGVSTSGDEVYGWIADGEDITAGTLLESAGNGTFQKQDTGVAVAKAMETVDNSTGGAPARMKLEVL